MFSSRPTAVRVTSIDDPPNEMNGRGIPVIGIRPTTAAMFMRACTEIHAVMPTATSMEKRSAAWDAM